MSGYAKLAREGLRGALETRRLAGATRFEPICIFDLAEKLGVEVRFCGNKSLGGMYAKTSETILIPTFRPAGRQAFTCGHELGHWFFGHGSHLEDADEIEREANNDLEEWLVNIFSSYLLMSPWVVSEALLRRSWIPSDITPFQAYTIACQLGVGYETLIQHLRWSLRLISPSHALKLREVTPKQLRQSLVKHHSADHLVIVDRAWTIVPIDLQVGDLVALPERTILEGTSAEVISEDKEKVLLVGHQPGISRVVSSDGKWAAFIRVSRKNFEGRSIYRHMVDPDGDQPS